MNTNGYKPNDIHYSFNDLWGEPVTQVEQGITFPVKKKRSTKAQSSRFKEEVRRFGFRYYNQAEALASGFDWNAQMTDHY